MLAILFAVRTRTAFIVNVKTVSALARLTTGFCVGYSLGARWGESL